MEQLLARIEALESQVAELAEHKRAAEARMRKLRGVLSVAAVCGVVLWPVVASRAGDPGSRPLRARVEALENLLQPFSRKGIDVYVTGANLHLRNGMNRTGSTNGTGNLIIGYDESRPDDDIQRLGSHNLVVGPYHNYGSYGGVVAGLGNTVSAPYASVLGGSSNVASLPRASVLGGSGNTTEAAPIAGR